MSVNFPPEIPTPSDGSKAIRRFLNPGEFFFCEADCQIHTLLGSCIAITLWHPILKVGGMCHFVLPSGKASQNGASKTAPLDGRYAPDAMELFRQEARRRGTELKEYEAKIFGGGNMLEYSQIDESELIGIKNIESAERLLQEQHIRLLFSHVGKKGHRRIAFDVSNGDVWVKYSPLSKVDPDQEAP